MLLDAALEFLAMLQRAGWMESQLGCLLAHLLRQRVAPVAGIEERPLAQTLDAGRFTATLSSFRWIESRMPTEFYAQFRVQFRRAEAMPEKVLRDLVKQYGFSVANLNYVLTKDGEDRKSVV